MQSYLARASRCRDAVERMKLVVSFVVAGLHRGVCVCVCVCQCVCVCVCVKTYINVLSNLGLRQKKPFNPILSEGIPTSKMKISDHSFEVCVCV